MNITSTFAAEETILAGAEKKVAWHGSISEDFDDSSVIVVLNRETTRQFKNYTADDFQSIAYCGGN